MKLNVNDFINDYLFELEENTTVIEKGIVLLKRNPQNNEELKKVERALHTIKGASRMLNFGNIEKISHGMESICRGIRENRYSINKMFIRLTFIATDYLRAGIRQIKLQKNDDLPVNNLLTFFEKAYAGEFPTQADLENLVAAGISTGEDLPADNAQAGNNGGQDREYNTVRIRTSTIDDLVKTLNNLIIREFHLKKEKETIDELEEALACFAGTASAAGFRSIEFRRHKETCRKLVQDLKKNFLEKAELIEKSTFELREQILSLRMLPLGLILNPLERMAEETALGLGKEVELQITGRDVMLDKTILENINDPLIHIIRNAIDHGIEEPAIRESKGKARAGRIGIYCNAEGGNIIIRIKDDGRGLDYEKIRNRAAAFAPDQEREIQEMNSDELHTFLFMPGFSTKKDITTLSGRGVGLEIAGHNIEKIKGKITVNSTADEGTEFIFTLPLSLATVEGFFVRSAGDIFLIPAHFTREILIVQQEDIRYQQYKKVITVRERVIPVHYLSVLTGREPGKGVLRHFVLVVESWGEQAGLIVDDIIQYASLIYKPLPRCLAGIKSIQGIVFNESFNIVNILYIPEIINKCRHQGSSPAGRQAADEQSAAKHILIVDDSFSTREIEKAILETEDFRVTTAVDGVEALEKLRSGSYHLIVSDINMPRMDGRLLLQKVKEDHVLMNIPVIVVSSEQDAEIRQEFLDAGASAFIVKSVFDRDNLVAAVKRLTG